MSSRCIYIPAVKKNVVFVDDLIKKLDGITLIQRCIDKARSFAEGKDIFIITDSEEISLIAERNNINVIYEKALVIKPENVLESLRDYILDTVDSYKAFMILWPYAPLLSEHVLSEAYEQFMENQWDVVLSVRETKRDLKTEACGQLIKDQSREGQRYFETVRACMIVNSQKYLNNDLASIYPLVIDEEPADIRSYHDWWVCESLLKRKKIIFRVIGNNQVGMGHVARALTLAHENTKDEILFVCDRQSDLVATKIVGSDYPLEVIDQEKMTERLIELDPDLVINDMLNTDKEYIQSLKKEGIKVVNFEDLGSGAAFADLTINELYDEPKLEGSNFRWGAQYSFLREEFIGACRHEFQMDVKDLLITFGGTDPSNLTLKTIDAVFSFCRSKSIQIHVVVGPGYLFLDELKECIDKLGKEHFVLVNQTGVMSRVMEKTQIAISSNGRTVYELAHMNIPSIIIAQHERERTHLFSQEKNGFINLGMFDDQKTPEELLRALKKLSSDREYRTDLYERLKMFDFLASKQKIIQEIYGLMNYEQSRRYYTSTHELNPVSS